MDIPLDPSPLTAEEFLAKPWRQGTDTTYTNEALMDVGDSVFMFVGIMHQLGESPLTLIRQLNQQDHDALPLGILILIDLIAVATSRAKEFPGSKDRLQQLGTDIQSAFVQTLDRLAPKDG